MIEFKHTPGPWEWDYFGPQYGNCLVGASPDHSSVRQEVQVGSNTPDGKLIAAAPELLDALREIAGLTTNGRGDCLTFGEAADLAFQEAQSKARAAIRKVTGK